MATALTRRGLLTSAAAAVLAGPARAAARYPSRSVRLVVPFAAGGGSDYVARLLSARFQARLGQPFIVVNRGGAGGIIGTELVAKSPPDGYNLLLGSNGPLSIYPNLYRNVPYRVADELAPISTITTQPFLIVGSPDLAAKTIGDVITLAKARPGSLNYGVAGIGSTPDLAMDILQKQAGVKLNRIAYAGGPPALLDLIGGRLQLVIADPNTLLSFVNEGKAVALAVTGASRCRLYKDVPTLDEAGLRDFDVNGSFGLLAPARTPPEVITLLSEETARVVGSDDGQSYLAALGGDVAASSPERFGRLLSAESARWEALIETYALPRKTL